MKSFQIWQEEKQITTDELQNELVLIRHHIQDSREYLKKKEYGSINEALDDIEDSTKRLEKFLSKRQDKEIDRVIK